ncbi:MAG: two-component regulator propeller domain-containing protein, partial [Bacteroidales bacterium]
HFKNDSNNNHTINSNEVFSIYEDDQMNLWVTTRKGLDFLSVKDGKFYHNEHNVFNKNTISDNLVTYLYRDNAGLLWIGTEVGGLNYIDLNHKGFKTIKSDILNKNSLCTDNVFSMFEDHDGIIWIGTKGCGIDRYDTKKKQFKNFTKNPNDKNSLSGDIVRAICAQGKDKLWIGTDGGGLNLFDKNTGKSKHFVQDKTNKNSLSNDAVYSLWLDKQEVLWIGTYGGGLDSYDTKTGKFQNFTVDPINQMQNVVICLYEDYLGNFWVGTVGKGLLRFDKDRKKFVSYKTLVKDKSEISNNVITTIVQDRKGILWIGTGGGGLDKFDLKNGTITNYNETTGLSNDMVAGIVEDKKYNFWISTNSGLCKLDPYTETLTKYSLSDGLQSLIFNQEACLISKDGTIYFGGLNGINVFNPDSITGNPFRPKVILTDFKIYNKSIKPGEQSILKKSISISESIEISYIYNVFTFEFAALHFVSPDKNQYKYKMEGFDKDWIQTTADRRYATYTNLPGGDYIFWVDATNNDGLWSQHPIRIKVRIIPPFWQTTWFYVLLAIFIAIIIIIIIKIREHQFHKIQTTLEEKVRQRTEEIKNQQEELLIINEQLNQQKEELETQSDFLKEINNKLSSQAKELKFKSDMLFTANQELKAKNKLIIESIKYAKRIQDSILPPKSNFNEYFKESFVFFKPKDIVSGDFYWFVHSDTDEWGKPISCVITACIDCTGHGVPGAFMSMIANTLLNEIILHRGIQKPSNIIKELNQELVRALSKENDNAQDDGMDISICCVYPDKGIIEIASAMQKVYFISGNKLTLIEGDYFSLGELLTIIKKPDFTNYTYLFE